jgi:hypothetical protein
MMHEILKIPAQNIAPSIADILKGQGISNDAIPNSKTVILAEEAIQCLVRTIRPAGIISEVSKDDFAVIYEGAGMNEPQAPLGTIIGASCDLAIFVITLGKEISTEISDRFNKGDLATASILDSAASEAAEMAADFVESRYRSHLEKAGRLSQSAGIMRFSPGYCGWHMGAQTKLFHFLKPHRIGITLNDSLLMQPLKSISGVIVSGPKKIFIFDDSFSFCDECVTHSCRDRIKEIFEGVK